MKIKLRNALNAGIYGFMVGLAFYLLEMSVRFVYLYFWSYEQAPSDYALFIFLYAFSGFAIGVCLNFLIETLKTIFRTKSGFIKLITILLIAGLVSIVASMGLKLIGKTELTTVQIFEHFTVLIFISLLSAILAWALIKLKKGLGLKKSATLYAILASILILSHVFILSSFSWNRMLKQLPQPLDTDKPNVLLLCVDTLRPDRLGVYGYSKHITPNINKLAEEGVLFTNALSQSPWTRPSFGSLMTSKYPSQHGAFTVNDPTMGGYHATWADMLYNGSLREDMVTMAEIFQDNGYTTIALQTNWQASEAQNFDQGFQYFIYSPLFDVSVWDRSFLGAYASWLPAMVGGKRRLPFYSTIPKAKNVDDVFESLSSKGFPEPFFLWINLMDTHSPYNQREKGIPIQDAKILESYGTWDNKIPISKLSEAYDSEVEYVDYYIGKMYKSLEKNNLLDKTLIIFLSDHGEDFEDHLNEIRLPGIRVQGRHHGHSQYNELLNVPLILRYPSKVSPGSRIENIVRLIDVLPTTLDLVQIDKRNYSKEFEGMSFMNLINGEKDTLDTRISYSERTYFGLELKSIQEENHKMIYHYSTGRVELYNLETDPDEQINLVNKKPQMESYLKGKLDLWMKRMGPLVPNDVEKKETKLSKEEQEQLRSLGYIK